MSPEINLSSASEDRMRLFGRFLNSLTHCREQLLRDIIDAQILRLSELPTGEPEVALTGGGRVHGRIWRSGAFLSIDRRSKKGTEFTEFHIDWSDKLTLHASEGFRDINDVPRSAKEWLYKGDNHQPMKTRRVAEALSFAVDSVTAKAVGFQGRD